MKTNKFKLMGLLLYFAATAMLVSCTPEKEEETNQLVGTKWAAWGGGESYYVLEFPSTTLCQLYKADNNLVPRSDIASGSYKLSGTSINFTGVDLYYYYGHYIPQTGTISGNNLSTKGIEYTETSAGTSSTMEWNKTWNKR